MSADATSISAGSQALAAVEASASQLKSLISETRKELHGIASAAEAEAGLHSLQHRHLLSLRAEKLAILSDIANSGSPLADTDQPFAVTGPVISQTSSGWALNAELERAFDEHASSARRNLAPPPKKTLSDRLFRDLEGDRSRAAADSIMAMRQIVTTLTAEAAKLEELSDKRREQRGVEADALLQRAEQRLSTLLTTHAGLQARLPPPLQPWANEIWDVWQPVQLSGEVFAGHLRPRRDDALGDHGDFGSDVVLPQYFRPGDGLHLIVQRSTRARAQALVRALLLRSLASHAPGALQLTVFDPVGLGQSVAPLLELAEYDPDLLGGKVWSGASDFKAKLQELTGHTELVVQKFLRMDYATLAEFNAAADEIAVPYRLLVVFDFPAEFDGGSFDALCRIMETGPRCGVGTVIITNGDEAPPHGIDLGRLPQRVRRINMASPFAFQGPGGYEVLCDLDPDSDELATATVGRLIESIGAQSRDRSAQNVDFEKVFRLFIGAAIEGKKRGLPRVTAAVDPVDSSSWWSQTTLESVASPIGQRGARDVAALSLDSSDHAGALLVGRPGSGKSTLLHTFIRGVTTVYGPQELELHLIDFKEGVEFKVYAAEALPHARTVAIESDREFGVSVLEAINEELRWRASLLRGSEESHSSLESLRNATGDPLPRIVLVFDEFQVLFSRTDKLGGAAAEALETLIRQGRGFGIHVILGSQSLAGLDALGSHVLQLLPVRILLPAAESDAFKVLGEGNTEGAGLTSAGEGILNASAGAVEANERFRGALVDEADRRRHVAVARAKADEDGFHRRPVVFEGNAPIPAESTPPAEFADEVRGAGPRALRIRFGTPMSVMGTADVDLHRESSGNVLLVARDVPQGGGLEGFSLPQAVAANVTLSAVAQGAMVEVADFMPIEEGLEPFLVPLLEADAVTSVRRRAVPELLTRLNAEVQERVAEDDTSAPTRLLVLYGMHRARDFDQDSVDYDAEVDLPELLGQVMRDGPEVGVHTLLWFDTVAGIARRLPSATVRAASWRLAGRMGEDDSLSLIGVEAATSLREQQLVAANEDRGLLQRCTAIARPGAEWTQELLRVVQGNREGKIR